MTHSHAIFKNWGEWLQFHWLNLKLHVFNRGNAEEQTAKIKAITKSTCEHLVDPSNCVWLQENSNNLSWLSMANLHILLNVLIRLPFLFKLMEFKSKLNLVKCANEGNERYHMVFSLAIALLGIFLTNTNRVPWAQISPVNETLAWIGFYLGILSSVGMFVTISSLFNMVCVEEQKDHRFRVLGPYRYARHSMKLVFLLHPVTVFLMAQNYVMGACYLPLLFTAFARVKRDEKFMLFTFGQEYVEYMKRVPAFGPLQAFCSYRGLTEKEVEEVLKEKESCCKKATCDMK